MVPCLLVEKKKKWDLKNELIHFEENLPKSTPTSPADPYKDYTLDELISTLERTVNNVLQLIQELSPDPDAASSLNFCVR